MSGGGACDGQVRHFDNRNDIERGTMVKYIYWRAVEAAPHSDSKFKPLTVLQMSYRKEALGCVDFASHPTM